MTTLQHKFIEFIPDVIEEGTLYISIEFCTSIHKCVCGCGNEVVTPLSPTDWKLTFDGKSVSLDPSIGNWNFKCKSHYWIIRNQVKHAMRWSEWKIEEGRKEDTNSKMKFFKKRKRKKS